MPVLLLLREREQRAQDRWHELLDVRDKHVPDLRALASGLYDRIEAGEDDDRLRARVLGLGTQFGDPVQRGAGDDDRAGAGRAGERGDGRPRVWPPGPGPGPPPPAARPRRA